MNSKVNKQLASIAPLYPSVGSSPTWETTVRLNSPSLNGRSVPFPKRLLNMIRKESVLNPKVVRWSGDGRAFFVDDEAAFVSKSLPRYGFKASKMQSFQRNLNIYGFTRLSKGEYASGYTHSQFGRDIDEAQLEWICRENVKKDGVGSKSKRRRHREEYEQFLKPCMDKAVTRSYSTVAHSPQEEEPSNKMETIKSRTNSLIDSGLIHDHGECFSFQQQQEQLLNHPHQLQQQLFSSEPSLPGFLHLSTQSGDEEASIDDDDEPVLTGEETVTYTHGLGTDSESVRAQGEFVVSKDRELMHDLEIQQNEKQELIKAVGLMHPREEQRFIRANHYWSLPHQPFPTPDVMNLSVSHSPSDITPTAILSPSVNRHRAINPPITTKLVNDRGEDMRHHKYDQKRRRLLAVSTVTAPYDTQPDYFLDRIYVRRCIPEIPFEGEEV